VRRRNRGNGESKRETKSNDYGKTLHILGFLQLRGLLDEDFAVELDDVQRLQHVVLLDHLLRLLNDNAHHSVSLLQTGKSQKEGDTDTRDTNRQMWTYADERAVDMADREELPDIAAGDGPAAEARPAGDGEARHGELDQGLELGGLLGGALAEEAHGSGCGYQRWCRGWCGCGGELLMACFLYWSLDWCSVPKKPDLLVDYGVCSGRASLGCVAVPSMLLLSGIG
jgi:hypothetical protein